MKHACKLIMLTVTVCLAAVMSAPSISFATETSPASESISDSNEPQTNASQDSSSQTTTSEQAAPVFDAEGLLAMASNPYGSYRLMCDVDLADNAWQPIEFHGTLLGDGHAILNASVTSTGQARRTTYDGNMKEYDTSFAGFFDTLEGATVQNVVFLGLNVDVSTSEPTFVGSICGYMDNAVIEGCTVGGEVSLATSGASFGVGGIAGFGRGRIADCVADTTLVCRDLDAYQKDEQFMGGAYGVGYADLLGNTIILRGYDSDHGYVHNGGMVGMYIVYDESASHSGIVSNNRVQGFITFFEDNEDRRAYCEPEIGENMSMDAITTREGNTSDFTPDERFEYDQDLLPHTCENPQWTEEVIAGTCTDRGRTQRTCANCGYTYPCNWTPTVHEVGEWSADGEPDASGQVVRKGTCTRCGAQVFERASADATASSTVTSDAASGQSKVSEMEASETSDGIVPSHLVVGIVLGVLVLAVIAIGVVLVVRARTR